MNDSSELSISVHRHDRDRLKLWANMAGLLSSMDDPQGWADQKSRRMTEIMELAPSAPEGRLDPLDEARADFARFHALWLKHCIDTGEVERIPVILSATQGRELVTRLLDELTEMEEAGQLSPAVEMYQQSRKELRKLKALIAGVVEGHRPGEPIDGSGLATGNVHELSHASRDTLGQRPAGADRALLQRLEAKYRDLHRKLPELRTTAAGKAGYEALVPPRLDAAALVKGRTEVPGSGLAEDEALVLFVDVAHGADVEGALVLRHGRQPAWCPLPGVRALAREVDAVSERLGMTSRDAGRWASGGAKGAPGAIPETETGPALGTAAVYSVASDAARALKVDLSRFWEGMECRMSEFVWQPLEEALAGIDQVVCVTQGRLHLLPLDLGAPKGVRLRHYPGLVYYGYRRGLLGRAGNRQPKPRFEGATSSPPTIGLVGYGGEKDTIPFVWGEVEALKRLHEKHGSVQIGDPYDRRPQDSSSSPAPSDYALLHLACHGIPVGEGMRERVVLQLGPGRALDMGRIMDSRLKVDQVLIAACLGGKVREDLDGEPSGVVGGYLYGGTAEVAAAVVALPDSWTMLASILIHQAWLVSGSLGEAVAEGKRRLAEGDWYPDTRQLFIEAATTTLPAWQERKREPLRQYLAHLLARNNKDEWNRLVTPLTAADEPDRYSPGTLLKGAEGPAWGERIDTVAAEVANRLLDTTQAIDDVLANPTPPQPLLGAIIHGLRTFGEAETA